VRSKPGPSPLDDHNLDTDGESLLRHAMFGCEAAEAEDGASPKVVSVALSRSDMRQLQRIVRELRRRGAANATKSAAVRLAIRQLRLEPCGEEPV
jgi:hypothetical protein